MDFLSAEELVVAMYSLGLQLFVGDDRVVHGKMRDGSKLPLEAWKLVDQLHLMNDAVARYLESNPITTLVGITSTECLPYGERIKSGELRLFGKVVYHKGSSLCDISFQEVTNCG